MVLQEMMTTTENTARHENTTKLGLKTTDKSCKAALLNEKLCVLDDDDDDAAVPLGCSPLLTSATKSKLLPFLLKSWMFLLSTCSQQQATITTTSMEKIKSSTTGGNRRNSSSTSSNHGQ
jgi:hypothetical protein